MAMATILLIEDNEDIRNNISEILLLAGFDMLLAEDGKAGVGQAKKYLPDLIICDIMMPVLDGYGVLKLLQRNKELRKIPFIFMTAVEDGEEEHSTEEFIKKPFDVTVLLQTIEHRLKNRRST